MDSVAPEGFAGVWLEAPADVWIPIVMQDVVRYAQNYSVHNGDDAKAFASQGGIEWLQIIGRAPQGGLASVRASLAASFEREMQHLAESYAGPFHAQLLGRRAALTPVSRGLSTERNRLTTPLVALLAMVAIVLLIACANAANLLLARAASRRRELAIRLSMGASRLRLARQLLTESAILVGAASGLGTLLAYWGSADLARRLVGAAPGRSPFPPLVDGRVLAFSALVCIVTVLLGALAPAARATRHEAADVLRGDTRTMRSGARLNASKVLVALQVALSLTLVVGAGLFGRSLLELTHIRLGFEPDRLLSVRLNLRASGVFGRRSARALQTAGRTPRGPPWRAIRGRLQLPAGGGVPRFIERVNRHIPAPSRKSDLASTASEPPEPLAYYPISQVPRLTRTAAALEVRIRGASGPLADALRKAVAEVAPALLVDRITTTVEQVDQNLRHERVVAQVTGGLGFLAIILTSFGLFGVMSYNVARRTGELGVRFAIGASRVHVLWMILRESLMLALAGLAVGMPAVLLLSRLLSGLLFGVAPNDPTTIAVAAAVMIGVAMLAGFGPAWKASRVDPMVALRQE